MSPAKLQLVVAIVERRAREAHEEYMEHSERMHGLFEELQQINVLRDELRAEAASVDEVSVLAETSVCPSEGGAA